MCVVPLKTPRSAHLHVYGEWHVISPLLDRLHDLELSSGNG